MEVQATEARESTLAEAISRVRDTVRRRWLVLLIVTLGVFLLGVAAVFSMTPRYSAETRIRIDPSRDPIASQNGTVKNELSSEAIETEVSSIYSLNLARHVVRKLNLVNDAEYAKGLDKAGPLSAVERETRVANAVLNNLSVYREKLTYVLGLGYQSTDPIKAAQIANAFAQEYIDGEVGGRASIATRQTEWYRRRMVELSAEVRAADAEVAQFRARTGLVKPSGDGYSPGTITDQQVAPLSGTLAQAESDAAGARSNLSAAQTQVSRGRSDAVAEVLNSATVTDLRSQRAAILRDQADVLSRYGDLHPTAIRNREQLALLDQQITAESARVVRSLGTASAAASARAASLRRSLGGLEAQRAIDTRNSVVADSLEREAAAKRALFDRLTQQSLDSMQAARNSISQAAIIDPAEPPRIPSSPNKPLYLALALIVGLAGGAGVIAVQEMLAAGIRTSEEVEARLGLPVLAAIPNAGGEDPAEMLLNRPTSFFAESFRIARAAVLAGRDPARLRVIAITSAVPGEGKTTTAVSFARTLAIAGARTLLLECDVRRAVVQRIVHNRLIPAGLVEVLHGEATVDQAIQPSDVANLDQLLVKAPYYTSENLFGDGKMAQLIASVRDRYDHIVLDLPPLLGLADGRALTVLADATILVIKWNSTPANVAGQALSLIRGDGADPIGALVSMVDSSAEMVGGQYYMKRYSDYYQDESK